MANQKDVLKTLQDNFGSLSTMDRSTLLMNWHQFFAWAGFEVSDYIKQNQEEAKQAYLEAQSAMQAWERGAGSGSKSADDVFLETFVHSFFDSL